MALLRIGPLPQDALSAAATFHGTGTHANDVNESEVTHLQMAHLGRAQELRFIDQHAGQAVFPSQQVPEIRIGIKHAGLALQPQARGNAAHAAARPEGSAVEPADLAFRTLVAIGAAARIDDLRIDGADVGDGQQLLLGAYSALSRTVGAGLVELHTHSEMLDLVVVNGHAKGIVTRDLVTGKIESHAGDAVLLCTGGYGNVFYLSTNAQGCNVTATYRAHRRGAGFANPCYTQIHPTCIPVHGEDQSKLTLMSESLRNDGRVWVPKNAADCAKPAAEIPEDARDYFLERKYPSYGNLAPRDIASRAAKEVCGEGRGVGQMVDGKRLGVYLDFSAAIQRLGEAEIRARYGNLFDMYENITGENAYKQPMRIFPAVHYTMGGLWVDYNLQSNIPGLFVGGEANFSDHGANRLGASALMQGLADGYFVLPYTVTDYLAGEKPGSRPSKDAPEFKAVVKDVNDRVAKLLSINGTKSPRYYHKALGKITWEKCGMARDKAGLEQAIRDLQALREDFWKNVKVVGTGDALAPELERAGRVADFLDFGIMMCLDALTREESCGGHFRTEHQDAGEAKRDDAQYAHAAVWQWTGDGQLPVRHVEPLVYEETQLSTRSYK